MAERYKIGIDFGTSNSTCAVLDQGKAVLVPLEGESLTLPSAMFFHENGEASFGRAGVAAYLDGAEGRFMRGLKSILGTSLMAERTLINRRSVTFNDIIARYISHLKDKAELYTGGVVEDVVLGRPVHFHDDNPEADLQAEQTLRDIAQHIGFKNISFQYEPIAAAFSHEQDLSAAQLALVVDLGGGTSDFTVIRLAPDRDAGADRSGDILATSGVRVGGTNFDQRLSLSDFMPHLGLGSEYSSEFDAGKILPMPPTVYYQLSDWAQVHFGQTPQAIREVQAILRSAKEPQKLERLVILQQEKLGHALLQVVESTKIALTDRQSLDVDLKHLDLGFDVSVTRAGFEACIAPLTNKISAALIDCLQRAQVSADEIGLVILTGGSSELPIINKMIAEQFPGAARAQDNKFGSVGLGLAYNARYVFS